MFWRVHNYDLKKITLSCLTVGRTDSIMVLARAWMFWRVHNYDMKKKMYSRLAVGRNDNYDTKKQTVVWRVHNYVRKKGSVVWPSVRMVGGVAQAWMFRRFIITT